MAVDVFVAVFWIAGQLPDSQRKRQTDIYDHSTTTSCYEGHRTKERGTVKLQRLNHGGLLL